MQEEDEDSECPVCYECLLGTERTLSCGHVFCHDCLVKTLVSVHRDGVIRNTIVCPICRHLTFIRKQKEVVIPLATGEKHPDGRQQEQTLEVPVPPSSDLTITAPLQGAQHRASGEEDSSPRRRSNWITRCFGDISERVTRGHRLVSPGRNNASQIFIISDQGRPMVEEDTVSVVMTAVVPPPRRRRGRKICTTARFLVFLLSAFTLLALVAATLPWILLA